MVETRIHPVVPDVAIIKRNKVKKNSKYNPRYCI